MFSIERQGDHYLGGREAAVKCEACGDGGPLRVHAELGGSYCGLCIEAANELRDYAQPGVGISPGYTS